MRARLLCSLLLVGAMPATRLPAQADSAVARFLRGSAALDIEIIGPARPLGQGANVVWAVRPGARRGAGATVHACVVSDSAGAPAVSCIVLPTPRIDSSPFAAQLAERREGDLDGDVQPEALASITWNGPEQAVVGADAWTSVFAIAPGPRLRLVANVALDINPGSSFVPHVTAEFELVDVNGDGHPDIVIEGERCDQAPDTGDARCRDFARRYLWNARTDGWAAPAAGGRR